MGSRSQSLLLRYAVAMSAVAVALVIALALGSLPKPDIVLLFFAAVVVAAMHGGLGPGLCATTVAALSMNYFLLDPVRSLALDSADIPRVGIFVVSGLLVSLLSASRKRAQLALFASNSILGAVIEGATDAVFVKDLQGRYSLINPAVPRFVGKPAEEIIDHDDTEIFPPETAHKIIEVDREIVATGSARTSEVVAIVDGVTHTYLSTKSPHRDAAGKIIGVIGIAADITERKQVEDELYEFNRQLESCVTRRTAELEQANALLGEAEQRYRTLFTQAADGLLIIDPETACVIEFNNAACRQLGYTRDEFARLRVSDFEAIETPEQIRSRINKVLGEGRDDFETQHRARDGKLRSVHVTVQLVELSGRRVFQSVFRDITDRKLAEKALRESEERYRALFETSPDGVAVFDNQMNVVMANRRAVEMYGYESAEEMIGISTYDLIAPEYRRRAHENTRQIMETASLQPIESIGVKKDAARFAAELSAALIRDAQGQPVAVLGVSRDITERKLAEEERRASHEQLRALSARLQSAREEEGARIARELHDELGGALTGLKWDLEGIDKTLTVSGKGEQVRSVREKIPIMTTLIDETIDTVRRISSELRPGVLDDLGLVAAIEWQAQQFQSRTRIRCDCDATLDTHDLDREAVTAVFRIFQEILTNVIRHAQATLVNARMLEDAGVFVLEVTDNGRGITDDEKKNTRSLGLLGMRERAHLVGGEIGINGADGKGTTVVVRVPMRRSAGRDFLDLLRVSL